MKWTRKTNPFAFVLNEAADRLFDKPVWLGEDLFRDPVGTLHLLSAAPEQIAPLRPGLTAEQRLHAINNVVTSAKAFLRSLTKKRDHASNQTELPLDSTE